MPPDIGTLLQQYGPYLGLLLLVLIGGAKEKPAWVFGWVYLGMKRDLEQDRDQWRNLALKGTELGTRGMSLAQSVMTPQQKEP